MQLFVQNYYDQPKEVFKYFTGTDEKLVGLESIGKTYDPGHDSEK